MARISTRFLAAASAGALIAGGAASASAQQAYTAGPGVQVEVYDLADGTNVIGRSATAASYARHGECSPPQELVPAVTIWQGQTTVSCWNQGYDGPTAAMGPWQFRAHGDAYLFSDGFGSIHVLTTDLAYANVGPGGVWGASGLSSRS